MEIQIQDLVTSIRKEGIERAQAEAEYVLADARRKADEIVSEAYAEAKGERESAERAAKLLKESTIISAEQAKRDVLLSFKVEIMKEYEKILAAKIKNSLNDEALGKLIKAVVTGEDVAQYAAEVAEVSEGLKAELAEEIRQGLEIRPVKGIKAGFRLANKDGSGFFDCSDEEIMQMLMPHFRNSNI